VLDDIPGIGPTRRRALMKGFASLEEIQSADVETLMEQAQLPRNAAEEVQRFFAEKKGAPDASLSDKDGGADRTKQE